VNAPRALAHPMAGCAAGPARIIYIVEKAPPKRGQVKGGNDRTMLPIGLLDATENPAIFTGSRAIRRHVTFLPRTRS